MRPKLALQANDCSDRGETMTAHVQGTIATRPSHRTAKLTWNAVALVTLAVAFVVTLVVLLNTNTDQAQSTPTTGGGLGTHQSQFTNDCGPTRIVHPC
jgi:hypothetical protein